MTSNAILAPFAALRDTGLTPAAMAAPLSLMLLWAQTPTAKLKGLPSFKDASADFVVTEPTKIVKALCPEGADELARPMQHLRPSVVESLRRALLTALDADEGAEAIAEAIIQAAMPEAWIEEKASALLQRSLGVKEDSSIRCAFSFALRPAWQLSKHADVGLDVESPEAARWLSLLAKACRRRLRVNVSSINSVDGQENRGNWDHALIFPPIGLRFSSDHQGRSAFPSDLSGSEAFGARWAAQLGSGRNIVVVGNGLLFRTSSKDAAFKQELIYQHGLEAVISLPRGTFPTSGIAVSALVFAGTKQRGTRTDSLRLIDASDLERIDAAAGLLGTKAKNEQYADASFEEVAASGFNLSVDRYVLDPEAIRTRRFLEKQPTVALSDLAEIRRPQALPRDSGNADSIKVREALLADIGNGRLSVPDKLSEIPATALTKIEGAILKPGDILLSIKGTIGKAALVTEAPLAEAKPTPIVPGQSFVIIRLRKGSLIRDPEVLFSYLGSPVAQSLLRGMAGGTTIQNVAMGQLKHMAVPIPSAERQAEMVTRFQKLQEMQTEIERLREKMKDAEEALFSIALGNNEQEGESHADR